MDRTTIDRQGGLVILKRDEDGILKMELGGNSLMFFFESRSYDPRKFHHDFFSPNPQSRDQSTAFALSILPRIKERFGQTALLGKLLAEHGELSFYIFNDQLPGAKAPGKKKAA